MNTFMNHFRTSEQHQFVEKGKEWRDIAMEKVFDANSKYLPVNPPLQIPMLSNTWAPEDINIEKINLSRSENSQKFCYVLHNVLSKEECQHLIGLAEQRGKYERIKKNTNMKISEQFGSHVLDGHIYSFDDIHIAEQIWQRVLKGSAAKDRKLHSDLVHVPWVNEGSENLKQEQPFQAVGLNEQMRILCSGPGVASLNSPHEDRPHVRASEAGIDRHGERSFVSFQLFLNDDFKEGGTRFLSEGASPLKTDRAEQTVDYGVGAHKKARLSDTLDHTVMPRTGSILLFQHNTMHQQTGMVRTAYGQSMQYRLHSEVLYSTQGPGSEYANRPIIARQFDDLY